MYFQFLDKQFYSLERLIPDESVLTMRDVLQPE